MKISKNIANLIKFTLGQKKPFKKNHFCGEKRKKIIRNKTQAFIRKKAEGETYKYAMYVYS